MNNKGITLVALVVTIIVLLILATVTIGLIIGPSGVFGRAQEAQIKSELTAYGDSLHNHGVGYSVDVIAGDKTTIEAADFPAEVLDGGTFDASGAPVYTITKSDPDNLFTLVYTIDLSDGLKSSYVINKN